MQSPVHRHNAEVAFGDTDASGWTHFPNFLKYAEAAEHAFLRSRGVLVFDRAKGGWPRVSVSCDFKRPLLGGDQIEVLLEMPRLRGSSITWTFEIINALGETAATGTMTNVRVDQQGRPIAISDDERARLEGV